MPRPKTHDEALRGRLLTCAAELISTDGVDALSLRKLAADVSTSTTAVYSLFGGKPGLIRTVYLEAFEGFARQLRAAASSDDPAEDLVQLGLAYRAYALAQPHLYTLLFTDAARAHVRQDVLLAEVSGSAFEILHNTVCRGVEAGVYVDESPEVIAVASWGLVHGLVSLELQHNLPPREQMDVVYERALRGHVDGWRAKDAT
ncbi:TetR/AcrR family transcriptional regulator [Kutzneria kofuensis]|uniref:AcrR family transcriptional regulator n=1 Tax=Kutzneria kofuensis TaxID=103725 RepID=A0A7W9KJ13_9PSEU|nr:WHG domain-containing protein [Kutzneria kofuensis]MBB5893456.1 AcrR family transcriptional regulator [Kutzneria kofuensis]